MSHVLQDYIDIFELSVDSIDENSVFDVVRDELIFRHYPIQELIKNPARWQVLKFK